MSYRFQKFATVDQEYLRQFKSQFPDYKNLSFDELHERFVNTHYGWANYFSRHLNALGNEAQDMFSSFEALQRIWAKENGLPHNNGNWLEDIALSQVRAFQPDVLMLEDLYLFGRNFREKARQVCRRPLIIIGWRAAPTEDYSVFKDLDLLLTCISTFAARMKEQGVKAALLNHGFEPTVLASIPAGIDRDLDFSFMGNIVLSDGFHGDRYNLIKELLQSTPLQVWSHISESRPESWSEREFENFINRMNRLLLKFGAPNTMRDRLIAALGTVRHTLPSKISSIRRQHPGRIHRPVYGLDYFKVLARSRITFNSHIDCVEDYAGNIRLFEATGMGACLVTDRKRNLHDFFDLDREVVVYSTADECSEKVRYLLDHEAERNSIAAAGQRRTLSHHTLEQRVRQVDEIIKGMLTWKTIPSRSYV
jgi:spore maturation protein CgeB